MPKSNLYVRYGMGKYRYRQALSFMPAMPEVMEKFTLSKITEVLNC